MAKRLIVNADGFGFTYGNNRGILECLPAGVVRSVSVNANFPAVQDTAALVGQFPNVSVGIHLDLSVGPCVSDPKEIPDLVDGSGQFLTSGFRRKAMKGLIPHEQMVRELSAQVERLTSFSVRLSHWDSHQNQHLYPPFLRAAIEVARRYGIPRMRTHDHHLFAAAPARKIRALAHLVTHPKRAAVYAAARWQMIRARRAGMRMADRLITVGLLDGSRKFDRRFWVDLFRFLPQGVSEVYCHPGYPDDTLSAHAVYVQERLEELKVLRDPTLADEAARCGVELISFNEL